MSILEKLQHRVHQGQNIHYTDNPRYSEGIERISKQEKSGIVMLGDSHISTGEWRGWANQGIGNDSTAGVLNRIDLVKRVSPHTCFIQIGINDVERGVAEGRIIANISTICKNLLDAGIRVGLMGIFRVHPFYPNASQINMKVIAINDRLEKIKGIQFIPIHLPSNMYLGDYIHFTPAGYDHIINRLNETLFVWKPKR